MRITMAIAAMTCFATGIQAKELAMADYLGQVRQSNASLRSLAMQSHGFTLAAKEPQTAFSPMLTGSYSHNESQNQAQPGTGLGDSDSYGAQWDLGIKKLFFTGTTLSLAYKSAWSETATSAQAQGYDPFSAFSAAQSAALTAMLGEGYTGPWYTSAPTLEISQSLWKGLMARDSNLAVEQAARSYDNRAKANQDQAQQVFYQAASAYIQLGLAQEQVGVRRAALERAKSTLAWTQKRAAKHLSEESDVLASRAAVKQAEVNLSQSQEDYETAAREFNAFRGKPGAVVDDELQALSTPPEDGPQRLGERYDVRAAEQQALADKAAAEAVAEKYRPDLAVFYNCSVNGAGTDYDSALRSQDKFAWVAGVRLTSNIDIGLMRDVEKGAEDAADGSKTALKKKREDLDKDWDNLRAHWRGTLSRVKDAEILVALQQEKMVLEKQLYEDGRSTHEQVLQYENDFNDAQLARLRLIAEACITSAKARYFNGAY